MDIDIVKLVDMESTQIKSIMALFAFFREQLEYDLDAFESQIRPFGIVTYQAVTDIDVSYLIDNSFN